jgi:hypothetical protein
MEMYRIYNRWNNSKNEKSQSTNTF